MTHHRLLALAMSGALGAIALSSCSGSDTEPFVPAQPSPGVIFTYPFDGQWDVPVGTRMVLRFTDPIDEAALDRGCTAAGDGALCLVGPSGAVPVLATVAEGDARALYIDGSALEPGATYELYARPALVAGAALNLSESEPLLRFHTRSDRIRGGELPVVLAVNGESPEPFVEGTAPALFPVLDFSTIRLLFSEPIDPITVIPGDTFALVQDDTGEPVSGALVVQGIHASFDPDEDLTPGTTYRLSLTNGILDMSGEPLVAGEYRFTPKSSRLGSGGRITQILSAQPASGGEGSTGQSLLTGGAVNVIDEYTPLIGAKELFIKDSTVAAEMADPAAFGGPIPITIRKGQLIQATGLNVALGGEVPANLDTGDITVQFISDASGLLFRNPHQAPGQLPDDEKSPVYVVLTFDVAVTTADPTGSAVINQNILNVQASGAAVIRERALSIETVGAMELDILGVTKAPSNLVLRLDTTPDAAVSVDRSAPTVIATYPAAGSDSFPVTDSLLITFSEPISAMEGELADAVQLTTADGSPIEAAAWVRGSTLVVTPRTLLAYGREYNLRLEGLADASGNAVSSQVEVQFRTPAYGTTDPTPPLVVGLYPGAPCALTGGNDMSAGRCTAGGGEDVGYLPFTITPGRSVEAYFDQRMDPATLALGQACGTGSVRVEIRGADGACQATVPGTLMVGERHLRFIPTDPWQVGQTYALTLVAGGDDDCDAGDICGVNGQPLNSDPLFSTADNQGGGPNLVIPFTGEEAGPTTYMPVLTAPRTDINGNGSVDSGEVLRDENRAAMEITDFEGLVSEVEITNDDCMPDRPEVQGCTYLSAVMPVVLGEAQANCEVTDREGNTLVVDRCIPARIFPEIIYGTSLSIFASIPLLPDPTLSTGRMVMRMRESPGVPITGYIYDDPATDEPRLTLALDMYLDAPDMESIALGLDRHNLVSKPLSTRISGPLRFTDDGRVQLNLTNDEPIQIDVTIEFAGIEAATIFLQIPAEAMKIQLVGAPARSVER